jgi:hypothetical protein
MELPYLFPVRLLTKILRVDVVKEPPEATIRAVMLLKFMMLGLHVQLAILLTVCTLMHPGIRLPLIKKVTLPSTSEVERIVEAVR